MRFRHTDFAPVGDYLQRRACIIQRLEWESEPISGGFAFLPQSVKRRAAHGAVRVEADEVAYFAGRGHDPSHASLVLAHYFHVNSTAAGRRPLSLIDAVFHVEADGAADEFLLVGHPDGGLISVSRERLDFQDGLDPITWWGP